jgi:hypothetical protein
MSSPRCRAVIGRETPETRLAAFGEKSGLTAPAPEAVSQLE